MELSPLINIHCLQINIYDTSSAPSVFPRETFLLTKQNLISHFIIVTEFSHDADCFTQSLFENNL